MPNIQDDSGHLSHLHSVDPPVSIDGAEDYKAHVT